MLCAACGQTPAFVAPSGDPKPESDSKPVVEIASLETQWGDLGVRLSFPEGGGPFPILLYVPGMCFHTADFNDQVTKLERRAHELGVGLLTFDKLASSASPETVTRSDVRDQALLAWQWATGHPLTAAWQSFWGFDVVDFPSIAWALDDAVASDVLAGGTAPIFANLGVAPNAPGDDVRALAPPRDPGRLHLQTGFRRRDPHRVHQPSVRRALGQRIACLTSLQQPWLAVDASGCRWPPG